MRESNLVTWRDYVMQEDIAAWEGRMSIHLTVPCVVTQRERLNPHWPDIDKAVKDNGANALWLKLAEMMTTEEAVEMIQNLLLLEKGITLSNAP